MSAIVFRLNDVPEDEAQAVRDLLTENDIEFYETSAGKWGFSVAAIWIKDEGLKDKAREIIKSYQLKHHHEMQDKHESLRQQGQLETFRKRFIRQPLQVIIYLILVLLVIYLTLIPFLDF